MAAPEAPPVTVTPLTVLALGGNALLPPGQPASVAAQRSRLAESCRAVASIASTGVRLVVTHGNGPQVGAALLRSEHASGVAYPWPLDVCVAATQGEVGFLLREALSSALVESRVAREVCTIVTAVTVRSDDPAFATPTKPIGPVYGSREAAVARARGWALVDQPPHGVRRVVASPDPVEVCEYRVIQRLVDAGAIVIALGGGGVPVVWTSHGLRGVEAVIDKDLSSALLAAQMGADTLVLATDVDRVYLDFGTDQAVGLDAMSTSQARRYAAAGQFPAGTMGPKVEAAVRFVEAGGAVAIVTASDRIADALDGRAGTRITKDG